ncbi:MULTISPECIES: glycosyltransferase [unclassified Xanthomonas]|uniref:glycosyltransferase n=1 Tax=unclassified Xanthomonas TaxID=2643310 RepID=UPI000CED9606|nr:MULTISPECIES: glycosyltransferase [unclassified Xanthomonas]PPU35261.1 glycosyl transferase [Xanthomonas sp. CFBP 7912]RJS05301.1 glycosyl transferase [Xanthomonas sp. CFBP 7698]
MRIDLVAPPYSGHLHPILAIARQLTPDHDVRVISTPAAQARIAACGLRAVSVLDAQADRVLLDIANPPHAVGHHPLRLRRQLHAALGLMAQLGDALKTDWRARRPDLVIVDFTLPSAGLAAQAMGIAWWTSMPSPCVIETGDGPPAYFGGLLPATTLRQRMWHALARRLTRGFKRSLHACYRRQMRACGLPALYRRDRSEAVYSPQCILALGVPAFEFAQRWPAALRFVGPQLCTPPSEVAPPGFVDGRRHVLVTLGTHLQWVKQRVDEVLRALAPRFPEVIFHFSDGDTAAPHQQGQGNYQRLPYVDYAQHLPRYALVVHHGGAGILYACLAAGLPAIVYPLDYDQFDHAARLQAAGAATWLRDLDELPARLDEALAATEPPCGVRRLQAELQATYAQQRVVQLVQAFAGTGVLLQG